MMLCHYLLILLLLTYLKTASPCFSQDYYSRAERGLPRKPASPCFSQDYCWAERGLPRKPASPCFSQDYCRAERGLPRKPASPCFAGPAPRLQNFVEILLKFGPFFPLKLIKRIIFLEQKLLEIYFNFRKCHKFRQLNDKFLSKLVHNFTFYHKKHHISFFLNISVFYKR